jgi:hypothetical protein
MRVRREDDHDNREGRGRYDGVSCLLFQMSLCGLVVSLKMGMSQWCKREDKLSYLRPSRRASVATS